MRTATTAVLIALFAFASIESSAGMMVSELSAQESMAEIEFAVENEGSLIQAPQTIDSFSINDFAGAELSLHACNDVVLLLFDNRVICCLTSSNDFGEYKRWDIDPRPA